MKKEKEFVKNHFVKEVIKVRKIIGFTKMFLGQKFGIRPHYIKVLNLLFPTIPKFSISTLEKW